MELHPENEPLLNKEDKDSYININEGDNTKSKEQIINKSCDKDFFEYLFFCCYNYDVTPKQYNNHSALSKRCLIQYDKDNPNHEKLLFEFFTNIKELITDEEGYETFEDTNPNKLNNIINNDLDKNNTLIKNLSTKIGFQNDNPRTDFRSGGLFSLEFMNYFVTNYKIESKNILNNKYFLFALVCINLCYKLCLILHLTEKETIKNDLLRYKLKGCTRNQIKNFCEHLEKENENDLIFIIMSLCLSFAFIQFTNNFDNSKKNENLLKINLIIDNTLEYFRKTLTNLKKNENLINKLKNEFDKAKKDKNILRKID